MTAWLTLRRATALTSACTVGVEAGMGAASPEGQKRHAGHGVSPQVPAEGRIHRQPPPTMQLELGRPKGQRECLRIGGHGLGFPVSKVNIVFQKLLCVCVCVCVSCLFPWSNSFSGKCLLRFVDSTSFKTRTGAEPKMEEEGGALGVPPVSRKNTSSCSGAQP